MHLLAQPWFFGKLCDFLPVWKFPFIESCSTRQLYCFKVWSRIRFTYISKCTVRRLSEWRRTRKWRRKYMRSQSGFDFRSDMVQEREDLVHERYHRSREGA